MMILYTKRNEQTAQKLRLHLIQLLILGFVIHTCHGQAFQYSRGEAEIMRIAEIPSWDDLLY